MKFFEDIRVGERAELGRHTFTADDIKAFAARFDPQPFHLDEAAAARSHFGALCASGWHTACVWMRLMVEHQRREDEERRARGEPVAALGPSPGFRDLKWLKPVYVGDTITYRDRGHRKAGFQQPPRLGYDDVRNTGINQKGEPVISFVSSGLRRAQALRTADVMSVGQRASRFDQAAQDAVATKRDERRAAGVACGAHALHDGYTDLIYVMLPVWQAEFGLGYAELGLLRGLLLRHHGGLPDSGRAARRAARRRRWCWRSAPRSRALGYCIAGASAGFGHAGDRAVRRRARRQHAASAGSALVARAFAGPRSMKALGTYNFAGDIGKMTVPAAASLLLVVMPWQPALALLGALGLVAAAAIFLLTPRYGPETAGATGGQRRRPAPCTRAATPLRLSGAAVDRHDRQRDPHGLPDLPAVRAHRQGREPADRRPRADAGVRGRRRRQAGLRLHRRAHRRDRDGLADRRPDRGRHRRAAAAAARSRAWCCCR